MKKYVVSAAQGGLGNRLKCLINSIRLSKKTNRALLVYWSKDDACNCNFNDLFGKKLQKISKEALRSILKRKNYEYYTNSSKKFKNNKKFVILDVIKFFNVKGNEFEFIDTNIPSTKINKSKRTEMQSLFWELKPKKSIIREADKFFNKNLNKNSIGIHIRKGDFVSLKGGFGNISPSEKFKEIISKEINKNPKIKIFIGTDSKDVENELKSEFGNRIISFPKKTKKREDEGSVREAFIDMMILSKTKKIYGTYGSTFNELASWINSKNQREVIFDKDKLNKYKLNVQNKNSKPFSKIKKVIYNMKYPFHKRFLDKK